MCDCGCNTCETKKAVMLNESIAPKEILSEGLKYHMDNNMPLTEHVYRAGSQSYFNLWAEARALYSRGILEVQGDDLEVLTETDLGHFGMFEGKKVPLDFPMINEDEAAFEYNKARAGRIMKDLFGFDFEFDYTYKLEGDKIIIHPEGYNPDGTLFDMKDVHKEKIIRTFRDKMPKAQATPNMGGGITVYLRGFLLNEAKKKKKKGPKLNKPMRDSSGGKAYKVYVKDPKTGNIKTVRFGSGGLRAKINDKKARNAFAKRHKCSQKKDKTKASYWSCRLPRYAKLLGLKSSFSGFW